MAIGQNWPLIDLKPLDESKPNSTQIITFEGTSHRPNSSSYDQSGTAHKRSTCKLSVSFYFFILFVSCHCAQQKRLDRIYTSNDAISSKEVPFGGSNASKKFQGILIPKTPKFGLRIGVSSLNKTILTVQPLMRLSLNLAQSTQPGKQNSKISTKSP
jgi:hypothetical protein